MSRTEIRITGFGGQGVVLSGHIIGHACAVNAGKHATMIQSFGPEARGSACSATLVVSDDRGPLPVHPAARHLRGDVRRGLREVSRRAQGRRHPGLREGPGQAEAQEGPAVVRGPVHPDRRGARAGRSCRTSSCSASSPR